MFSMNVFDAVNFPVFLSSYGNMDFSQSLPPFSTRFIFFADAIENQSAFILAVVGKF